jgi:hypothetical protein
MKNKRRPPLEIPTRFALPTLFLIFFTFVEKFKNENSPF